LVPVEKPPKNQHFIIFVIDDDNHKLNFLLEALKTYFLNTLDYLFEQDVHKGENNTGDMNIKLILGNKETTSPTYNTFESYHLEVGLDKEVSRCRG